MALLSALIAALHVTASTQACSLPQQPSLAAAFDLAANGDLTDPALQPAASATIRTIPPSILKAVGWVESGWHQFTPSGRPLVSFDYGYGVMQITSGMAGAFGDANGSIDASVQSRIASDYRFNIGFGARILIGKWSTAPTIGDGDPSTVENWYYALWAYNGWGWVNNPNNPRFTRQGTPVSNPGTYPYQERVLYLVAHPPHDRDGNPLWKPIPVWMPPHSLIGNSPRPYVPAKRHREPPLALDATFTVPTLAPTAPSLTQTANVRLENTGTSAWPATGSAAISLTYHLFSVGSNPWGTFSPFSPGVIALGQGTVALPHDVLPGRHVTLSASVVAPATAGQVLVVWDLQQAPATWLSQTGMLPHVQTLTVLAANRPASKYTPTPTTTPTPSEGALYVVDTAVPDGTALGPRTTFQKAWLVFNNGSSAWRGGWMLRHQSGPTFGAKNVRLPQVAACRSANLVVQMRAPSRAGKYKGIWRIYDGTGQPVGDRLTVVITVTGTPPTRTPVPSATPTSTPRAGHPTPTPTATPFG